MPEIRISQDRNYRGGLELPGISHTGPNRSVLGAPGAHAAVEGVRANVLLMNVLFVTLI